jgi:hypothetical protein
MELKSWLRHSLRKSAEFLTRSSVIHKYERTEKPSLSTSSISAPALRSSLAVSSRPRRKADCNGVLDRCQIRNLRRWREIDSHIELSPYARPGLAPLSRSRRIILVEPPSIAYCHTNEKTSGRRSQITHVKHWPAGFSNVIAMSCSASEQTLNRSKVACPTGSYHSRI